eukprot:2252203-Alexandrium_andersonii.AAC.1
MKHEAWSISNSVRTGRMCEIIRRSMVTWHLTKRPFTTWRCPKRIRPWAWSISNRVRMKRKCEVNGRSM